MHRASTYAVNNGIQDSFHTITDVLISATKDIKATKDVKPAKDIKAAKDFTFPMTDDEIRKLLETIHGGKVDPYNLPEDLYYATAEVLKKGLGMGFGTDFDMMPEKDLQLLDELTDNIYMFSAAKTYQQVRDMTDALTDDDGKVRTFREFKQAAGKIFEQYNENYLSAEYDTAIASGQAGVQWNNIYRQRKTLPFLKMSVVEDANTSDICEPLDGITLPVEDPFWDIYYPPNHFRCRTTVQQLDQEDATVSSTDQVDKAKEHADQEMSDVFRMNVGKEKVVFNREHPYFTNVPKADRGYASENFDLPIPGGEDE